jgi:hypothetical protein
MIISKRAIILLAGSLGMAISQASATTLQPGTTISNPGSLPSIDIPTGTSTATSSTTQANLLIEGASWKSGPTVSNLTTKANITFANGVWIDPTTGGLDFFYQIQNTFMGQTQPNNTVASSFVLGDYANIGILGVYQLDYSSTGNGCAFFGAGPCPPDSKGSGFLQPTSQTITSVSRSTGTGDDLTVLLSGGVTPGTNSAILVIQTNSTDFDQAGSGIFTWMAAPTGSNLKGSGPGQATGGPWELDSLEPLPTPEPGSYGVLALGVAGLVLFVRWRAEKARSSKAPAATEA